MDALAKAELLNRAIQILIQRAQLDDAERVEIAEFHEEWKTGKNYGSNIYLRYGLKENGRAQLYRTTRNVNPSTTPPDVPSSPQAYVKVG